MGFEIYSRARFEARVSRVTVGNMRLGEKIHMQEERKALAEVSKILGAQSENGFRFGSSATRAEASR